MCANRKWCQSQTWTVHSFKALTLLPSLPLPVHTEAAASLLFLSSFHFLIHLSLLVLHLSFRLSPLSFTLSLHPPATAQEQNTNYRLTYMSRNVAKAGTCTHTHGRTHRYEALVNRWRCGKGMFALFACPSLLTLWAQGTLKCSTVNRSSNIILKLLKSRFQTSVRRQTRRVCVKSCLV